jgi:hypothetical protein
MFIESIFEGKELLERISSFLKKLLQGVDEIAKKIPEVLIGACFFIDLCRSFMIFLSRCPSSVPVF